MVQENLFGNHDLNDTECEGEEPAQEGNTYVGIWIKHINYIIF